MAIRFYGNLCHFCHPGNLRGTPTRQTTLCVLCVRIQDCGRSWYLGSYESATDAARAWDMVASAHGRTELNFESPGPIVGKSSDGADERVAEAIKAATGTTATKPTSQAKSKPTKTGHSASATLNKRKTAPAGPPRKPEAKRARAAPQVYPPPPPPFATAKATETS